MPEAGVEDTQPTPPETPGLGAALRALLAAPDLVEAPENARLTRLGRTVLLCGAIISLVLGPFVTFLLSP